MASDVIDIVTGGGEWRKTMNGEESIQCNRCFGMELHIEHFDARYFCR